ncbi:MAG: U32 family peptidase [Bacteroidales bacterium]|nr:U32 family peptidase [Bacteroidales bacterium]
MHDRLSFRPKPQAEWRNLELLAPARTADIGIAAVDCGADAVYIAGPAFGARQAAGNPVEDIRRLCDYAHRFGVRIYVTFNTLVYEEEIPQARRLLQELQEAGVDALIVQDAAVTRLAPEGMILHASTQCAIRTPEKARFTESLGYGRLVLERELSLDQIRAIREAVDAELEVFVHGALCVCYSGQCYLSEHLAGRSANRGACIQACRSLYDLEDGEGKVLARNKALLSLKDFNLIHRLEDLAEAGADSFKIEGRLKSISYVRNVVRAYSEALDALVRRYPDRYRRASYGTPRGGFTPDLKKTFNRDYTELFLDGVRGSWAAMDAPKSMGEYIGTVASVRSGALTVKPADASLVLHNGDGFAFVGRDGSIVGFRGDVCEGFTIRCKDIPGLKEGTRLYRNIDADFERKLEAARPVREIGVTINVRLVGETLAADAESEDGRKASFTVPVPSDVARDAARMLETIRMQLAKRSGMYAFSVSEVKADGPVPFMPAAFLNGIRRQLADALDAQPVPMLPLRKGVIRPDAAPETLTYKDNIANSIAREIYRERGTSQMEEAYELTHRDGVEYMRTKYCLRHELGLCPKQRPGTRPDPLYLLNNGRRLRLDFDCKVCEMTVR